MLLYFIYSKGNCDNVKYKYYQWSDVPLFSLSPVNSCISAETRPHKKD